MDEKTTKSSAPAVMPPETLDYSSGNSKPARSGRRATAALLSWASFILGGLAVGFLPGLIAGRDSIVGLVLAAPIWLAAALSVLAGVVAIILRRPARLAWYGLLLGLLALVWSTAFMAIPPARRDF
jgi:hypothetical protein